MVTQDKEVYLIASASGIAAGNEGCSAGPVHLQTSPYFLGLHQPGLNLHWVDTLNTPEIEGSKFEKTLLHNQNLAKLVATLAREQHTFTVFGGDHACAIGTWSGAATALKDKGDLGLIWIDAHMDSHTPQTSQTGNIHGMPLAALLGYGDKNFTELLSEEPKLKPENLCLIGVRSFEEGEEALLKKLKVKVYYMDEINRRGLTEILKEARELVTQNTAAFGMSIDVDSVDPSEAPGTGVPEPDGLQAQALCESLWQFHNDPKLIGFEIVEFNPDLDQQQITEQLVVNIFSSLVLGKNSLSFPTLKSQ